MSLENEYNIVKLERRMHVKKIILPIVLVIIIAIIGCTLLIKPKDSNLKKVKVAEVTHSIFYAPQYVAHALGYFKDEGLDVEIILTAGVKRKNVFNINKL